MTLFKTIAVGALLLGSASLALAQGAGIAPDSSNLPPQTNPSTNAATSGAQTPAGTTAKKKTAKKAKTTKMDMSK